MGKVSNSCRLRCTNYLHPDLKHCKFSDAEEDVIVELHSIVGNRQTISLPMRWSLIAAQLPSRTDKKVNYHWNNRLKKKLYGMGIDPITHRPLSHFLAESATTPPQVAHLAGPTIGRFKYYGGSSYGNNERNLAQKYVFRGYPKVVTLLPVQSRKDQQGHGQPPVMGVVAGTAQIPYGAASYQANPMMGPTPPGSVVTPVGSIQSPGQPTAFVASPAQLAQHQLAYQHIHPQQQQQLQQAKTRMFCGNQYQEIEQTTDFKNHSLPLARIKKIMKADEDVRMISAEAPVLFAKACEMFILELTLRSWNHTEENKRRTLQKNDIAAAITRGHCYCSCEIWI
ncbi:uncharacterized protein LOC143878102 [Tasmannia lanceolata]|uniref:uncharacterized protein LOC143878102 n=1 Tax=Tasmannia lanceolata TaxID=3420 RepID=UPI004064A211